MRLVESPDERGPVGANGTPYLDTAFLGRGKCGEADSERERENFNHTLFALAFFSRRQDRELLGAISRGLLDCPRRV
jgi:hypothetical protein